MLMSKRIQGRYCFYSPMHLPFVLWDRLVGLLNIRSRCQREREKERESECKTEEGFLKHVKLRSKQSHLFLLAGRLSSTSADESLSWKMSFISPPKVSPGTPSPLLPCTLLSLRWDHKLLNIKPCFQSVRRASQCQGPSHPLLHLWRHLDGKSCLPLHIPLSLICTCITQPPPISKCTPPSPPTPPHKATLQHCHLL